MTTELILRPKSLTLRDLEGISALGHMEDDMFILERSPKNFKLKTPAQVPVERILSVGQKGLVQYIICSLAAERPRLIPFVLENQALIELARYLLRYRTGSPKTLYVNVDCIARYCNRIEKNPDELISDVKDECGLIRLEKIPRHVKALEDYVGELQDQGLAPSRIANYVKAIRCLYSTNGIEVKLPHTIPRTIVRPDRAPKPEELSRLLDVSDLRERVVISMLALAGLREGTLVRLQYRHVKEDLEKGVMPVHIHIESEITKGRYHGYTTFLAEEGVEYLRLYLDARRRGSPDGKMPPEEIMDASPIVRDSQSQVVKPVGERQVFQLVHGLYFKAGLLKEGQKGGYDLRVHSLRKFFKTQLMALGVQSDYADYMMGHTVDTYHDIQMNGVEFLRGIYARADLRIKPKSTISKHEMVIETIRHMLSAEELHRVEEALAEPDTKYLDPQERQLEEIRALSQALRTSLKRELLTSA
jgi:hypothetical protein